jgi:dTDP-4-amino-4,6-dideoxygalactose transaminase
MTRAATTSSSHLALLGGAPVNDTPWPTWPQADEHVIRRVGEVLSGGRWAVSGVWTGGRPLDDLFAERFASFVGARRCVPVDHGSSALVAALTALDVQPGDEVIVPGLTWVACASAVVRVGAIPVLVDIDADTLCVAPAAVEAAITRRTAAIMVVHLYSAMADMDRLVQIAQRHGLPIVEDAAQAHGARWRDRGAGSLGAIGTFSMQQGKVLTSGEGGAAVTSDDALYAKLEQLRGDGRRYVSGMRQVGRPDLGERSTLQGWNMHLSEMQAALLLAGLDTLPSENARRAQAANYLDAELGRLDGIEIVNAYPENTRRTYYHYAIRAEPDALQDRSVDLVCEAISAELGAWVHPAYPPLNAHPLYRPLAHPFARRRRHARRLDPVRFPLPEAHRQRKRVVAFHHPLLLAPQEQLAKIVEAVDKVLRHAHQLLDHTTVHTGNRLPAERT